MATNDIKYTLNAQLMDNTVTKDIKDDKILTLVSAGTADKQRVISEIMELNPGLERETVEAVINLEQRVVKKLVLTGFRVNLGLYQAVAQFTGVIEGMAWNPEKNTVYVSMNQGADLREAIGQTGVNIIGEKGSSMFVASGEDTATRTVGFNATAGRNFTLTGEKLKVVGTDPSVGITLKSSSGAVIRITPDMIAVNEPKRLIFLIPSGLEDGVYTLTITTQYSSGSLLKKPHSISQEIVVGKAPQGGGDTGGSSGSGGNNGEDGDPNDNPLG